MNTREIELNNIFNELRERLVGRYVSKFGSIGEDAECAVAKAFEYTARWLLGREEDFMEKDVENLLTKKMNFLLKDALVATQRDHGRRSVRAVTILDKEQSDGDDYHVAIIDKVSMEHYFEVCAKEGDENRFLLQAKAIDCVLMKHGVSARDRDIFDRCLYCNPDRTALAAEFQTSVSNIGRVKCECGKLAIVCASEIRSCHSVLAMRYEMQPY